MLNPFVGIWKEVRGNAVWDAIKWAWCAGGSAVTLALQWIVGVIRNHQDATATVITALAMLFFGVVALIIFRNPTPSTGKAREKPVGETQTNEQRLWEGLNRIVNQHHDKYLEDRERTSGRLGDLDRRVTIVEKLSHQHDFKRPI